MQADDDRHDQEAHGDAERPPHLEERQCHTGGEGRHQAKEDEAQDIVDHGRADHHARLDGRHDLHVRQDARRDSDGRGRERRAHEDRRGRAIGHVELVRDERGEPQRHPQRQRQHDADDGHRTRRRTHAEHLLQVGLEADFEQQDQHADLGQHGDELREGVVRGGRNDPEDARAQERPGDQLAQYRGLADPLEELPGELAHDEHRSEHDEEPHQEVGPVAIDGRRERRQVLEGGKHR